MTERSFQRFALPIFVSTDALTAACLFLGLAAVCAVTRSNWLYDWDSVNFAFGLDDFDVTKHWPHPPGFPVYIAGPACRCSARRSRRISVRAGSLPDRLAWASLRTDASHHKPRRTTRGARAPHHRAYVVFAWRGASKEVARPYLIASAVYRLMLFIMLPVRHLRYPLPLSLVIG